MIEPYLIELEVSDDGYELLVGTDEVYDAELGTAVVVQKINGDVYEGPYTVEPKVQEQVLETKDKTMTDNVTVLQVPYWQTGNEFGDTVYIASEV